MTPAADHEKIAATGVATKSLPASARELDALVLRVQNVLAGLPRHVQAAVLARAAQRVDPARAPDVAAEPPRARIRDRAARDRHGQLSARAAEVISAAVRKLHEHGHDIIPGGWITTRAAGVLLGKSDGAMRADRHAGRGPRCYAFDGNQRLYKFDDVVRALIDEPP